MPIKATPELKRLQTPSLLNHILAKRRAVDIEATKDVDNYTVAIEKVLGHSDFELTDIVCVCPGIARHVYAAQEQGPRRCIFCDSVDCCLV